MWDERYRGSDYWYGTEPNEFLAAGATRIPPGRVLSLADGEGRNGVHLASLGYEVTSVDASAVGLAKAQRLAATRGVSLATHVVDLADFEMGIGVWAGIVSIFCHLPPSLRRSVHAKVVRGLMPGGVFLLEAYAERQFGRGTGGPSSKELMLTVDALRDELEGLELIHLGEFERDVHEGRGHDGPSIVVQCIGKKPA